MLPKLRKRLLIQTAIIAFFSLSGFLILFYVILQALTDPRALKRMLGFDSFASFLLTSGSGILAVILLAGGIFLLVRRILFTKKIRGQTDALHRCLARLEAGDLDLSQEELASLPFILRRDIEALKDALISRFDSFRHGLNELGEVSRNLHRMSVDSSLRISFLNAQLESCDRNLSRMQATLDSLRIPQPNHLASILIAGKGPQAAALAHALIASGTVETIFHSACDADCMPTKSIPIETENETELIERLHERSISLVILVQPRALESETCNLLIAKGIQVFGHGNRILTLKGDTLRSMLDRYHIPRLAWSPVASTTEALAFATAHKAPWRLEARRLRPDEDAFFTDSAALERFLSAHPGIFDDPQPVTILTGEVARDYAVIAVCDRACMRMLGCAELAILAADNDTGPATPGCGAFAPAFPADHPVLRRINTRILGRLHAALRRVGITWHGFVTLRLHITSEGQPLLQDLTFGLLSPESDAILSAASRDLLSLCLTALRDELEEAEQSIETENNAIAIVFSGASQPPAAPAGASIIPYPNDAERSFSLICLRKRMEETIHTAYLAALPIIRTGQVHCRQDIGGRTLLARESGRRLRVRLLGISGFRRIYAWLLGPSSHSGRKRP